MVLRGAELAAGTHTTGLFAPFNDFPFYFLLRAKTLFESRCLMITEARELHSRAVYNFTARMEYLIVIRFD